MPRVLKARLGILLLRKLISAVLVSPESPLFPLAVRVAWTIPVVANHV